MIAAAIFDHMIAATIFDQHVLTTRESCHLAMVSGACLLDSAQQQRHPTSSNQKLLGSAPTSDVSASVSDVPCVGPLAPLAPLALLGSLEYSWFFGSVGPCSLFFRKPAQQFVLFRKRDISLENFSLWDWKDTRYFFEY